MPEHNTITDPDLHEPKGVAAATIGQVYIANGSGSGVWSSASQDIVLIDSASDLPTAVTLGGVLTHILEDKEYLFNQDMSIANPLAWPGAGKRATIKCNNRATITYTGTNSFFKDPDAEGDIEIFGLVEFKAPSGDFFDISTVTSSFSFQTIGGARFTDCNTLGTFRGNGSSGVGFFFGTFSNFDQGLIFQDMAFSEVNTMFMFGNNIAGARYLDFNGASTVGSVNVVFNTFGNGSNETLLDFDANIESGVDSINVIGNHQEGGINGTVFATSSLDLDTPKVNSVGNNGIVGDSHPDGILSLVSNATNTVITTQSVPVLAAGTWVVEDTSQFTGTTAGRLTYNGVNTDSFPITARVSMAPASGVTKTMGVTIAKNGTTIPASLAISTTDSGDPTSVSAIWQLSMSTGDFMEVFLSNETDTIDVLGSSAVLRVN